MQIVYEDAHVIVCKKPAGMLSESGGENSIADRLAEMRKGRGEEPYIGLVHRLDRETAGLMVFAKDRKGAAALSRAITEGAFGKEYLAVTCGVPSEEAARLSDILFKDSRKNKSFVVKTMRKGAKEAVLDYERLGTATDDALGDLALVRVRLLTGRTHQIRVQFASRRLPLCGDRKYGGRGGCPMALFAHRITFPHPKTGETLSFSALPDAAQFPWDLFAGALETIG